MRFKEAIATFAFVGVGSIFAPFGVAGALFGVTPAYATSSNTVHVVSTPDDTVDGAPWARDTFDRKTTVKTVEEGWLISFTDTGSFKTPAGLEGTLIGKGEFVVVGGAQRDDIDLPHGTIDRSTVGTKDDFTTSWWKRFIDGGKTEGIVNWKWTYKTDCEVRVETPNGAEGEYPSKKCPVAPGHPSVSPSTSHPASASPSVSVKPSRSTGAVVIVQGGLPVTGPSVGVLVATGAAVLALGAALVLVVRKRAARFDA